MAFAAGALLALFLPGAGVYGLAAVLPAALWVAWRCRRPWPLLLLVAGFFLAHSRAADIAQRPVPCGQRLLASAHILGIPERTESGWRFDARVRHPRKPGQPELVVRIDFPRQGRQHPRAGETWQLALGYQEPAQTGGGAQRALFRNGIHARARALVSPLNRRLHEAGVSWPAIREHIAGRIHQRVQDPSAAALIAALAVGATGEVSDRQWRVFSSTGISHLIAISGMHVTFLAMLSMMGARQLWRASALLRQHLRRETFAAVVGMVMAAGYSLLSGFSVPAQRTLVMLLAFLLLRETAREMRPCTALGIATVAVLAWDPLSLLDAGFWLSFAAVAAIILLPGARILRHGKLRGAADVQWAVSMALLPLTLVFFSAFSVAGLVVNIVAIPLFTLVLVPVILLATVGYLLPWDVAGSAADHLVDVAALLLRPGWAGLAFVADLPGATVAAQPLPLVVAAAGLAVLLTLLPLDLRIRGVAWIILAWTFLAARPGPSTHELEIEVLEAGRGSAVLLRTAHHSLLAGSAEGFGSRGRGFASLLRPQLAARLASGPDAWVLGRLDSDRLAALPVARARASALRIFAIAREGRQLPPELLPCGPRSWQWDGVGFDLRPAASGRGCLLWVATGTHRAAVLVDGDAVDRDGLKASAEPVPQLLLLPARGYHAQGVAVEGATHILVDDGLQRAAPGAGLWQRLTRPPSLPRCVAPT